jgi:hypothetical protein
MTQLVLLIAMKEVGSSRPMKLQRRVHQSGPLKPGCQEVSASKP